MDIQTLERLENEFDQYIDEAVKSQMTLHGLKYTIDNFLNDFDKHPEKYYTLSAWHVKKLRERCESLFSSYLSQIFFIRLSN